jgi:hypothetical protein
VHRLLVHKLCFGLVVLLTVPIVVLLLEGAPVLTIFSTTPGQLKVISQGSLTTVCYFFWAWCFVYQSRIYALLVG